MIPIPIESMDGSFADFWIPYKEEEYADLREEDCEESATEFVCDRG